MSMANGELGYVPTEEASTLGGYGADLNELKVNKTTGWEHVNYVIEAL